MEDKDNNTLILFGIAFVLLLVFSLFPYSSAFQPVLAIAVLAGYLYGWKRGFALGVGAVLLGVLFGVVCRYQLMLQLRGAGIAGLIGGRAT
ncbi:MAG: hypothetical protein V1847_00005 [Candidatus Diapherotrites archaeon]